MSFNTNLFVVCTLALGGCTQRVIDLGHDQGQNAWAATLDFVVPQSTATLYDGDARVAGLAADETHLYVVLEDVNARSESKYNLLSCEIASCGATLETLAQAQSPAKGLLLSSGELLWSNGGPDIVGLTSCSVPACMGGSRRLTNAVSMPMAADADYVYWLEGFNLIRRCSRAGCGEPDLIHEGPPYTHWDFAGHLSLAGDQIYVHYTGLHHVVWRLRRDGSGDESVVYQGSLVGAIATDGGSFYAATSVLTGEILRCPLDGCGASMATVATGQRWPFEMKVDDRSIYWFNMDTASNGGSVATCPIAGVRHAFWPPVCSNEVPSR
jgi:hypothetical protein